MKIASIDIGSNSIHLAVVLAEPGQRLQIIDREKEMARLAAKTLRTRRLSEETIDRAVTTLRRFKQIADVNEVELILTTATSAVREAENARDFVEAVRDQVGLEVQVLPGVEEARLIALAVSEVTEFDGRRALIIDIGGGSTEFILTSGGEPDLLRSARLGAVRLSELFITTDPVSSKEYRQLEAHIRTALARVVWEIKRSGFDFIIGTSGTILNLVKAAAQAKAAKEGIADPAFTPFQQTVSAGRLKRLSQNLLRMNMHDRSLVPGLDAGRADIIVAGGLLLATILEELKAARITTCDWSLREGVILDYLRRQEAGQKGLAEPSSRSEPGESDLSLSTETTGLGVRTKSVLSLARRYTYDAPHSHQVARLAGQIFDGTKSLHRLADEERRLLAYAGLLHDIGYYIAHEDHHRHGLYLIKNSEMPGFTSVEIAQIANLVRYLRGRIPGKDDDPRRRGKHADFFALERRHRLIVKKLTGILRIADALDRSRQQAVRQVRCEMAGTAVTFYAQCENEADLEVWTAERAADLFRDTFQVDVKFLREAPAKDL